MSWGRSISGLVAGLLLSLLASSTIGAEGPTRPATDPTSCRGIPHRMLIPDGSKQLITVMAADHSSTTASLQAWGRSSDGCFERLGPAMEAFVGVNGTSTAKREGDGATPVGIFRIGSRLFELGSPLPGAERHQPLGCGSWWDEDPKSPTYNRFVQLACGEPPSFGGDSEALWRSPAAYQHFVEIRYNARPAVPGWGSGIFLHDSTGQPTAGCVALPAGALELVLSWLDPAERPLMAIGMRSDLLAE